MEWRALTELVVRKSLSLHCRNIVRSDTLNPSIIKNWKSVFHRTTKSFVTHGTTHALASNRMVVTNEFILFVEDGWILE